MMLTLNVQNAPPPSPRNRGGFFKVLNEILVEPLNTNFRKTIVLLTPVQLQLEK